MINAGAASVMPQSQIEFDALFYQNALQPDISESLQPSCYGIAQGDEFSTNNALSLSTAFASCFPGGDVDIFSNISNTCETFSPAGPYMTIDTDESGALNRSFSSKIGVPRTNQVHETSFCSSHWTMPMDSRAMSCYDTERGPLDEGSANDLLFPTNFNDDQRNRTSDILMDPEYVQNIRMISALRHNPGFEETISSTLKFLSDHHTRPSTPLPDPYRNTMTCSMTAMLLAFLANATCIGFSINDLRAHKSPFYNASASPSDDPHTLLDAARKPWIPIYLQPSLPQILYPHHPYLDLLPFPALRARAIMLGAAKPQLFCPMALKKDVFKEGLACLRDDERGNRQPWDMASWKTAPWFASKWRLLLGY